ncbi:MAG: hypothetical protein LBM59_00345 [Ruminococcus sp.]|jgi:hypothetical protein|nr:hypothetical protein [Ruminococcus sp.]
MQGFNVNVNNGFPPVLPKKLGDILYFDSADGYKYLLMNLGAEKKAEELDENGFTKEQAARIMARINNPDRSKDVVFTPEEWDAYGIEHGLI